MRKSTPKKAIPVKIVGTMPATAEKPSSDKDYEARERRWKAESDLRTMQDAEAIRRDKSRMAEMKKVAKEQMAGLKKIC